MLENLKPVPYYALPQTIPCLRSRRWMEQTASPNFSTDELTHPSRKVQFNSVRMRSARELRWRGSGARAVRPWCAGMTLEQLLADYGYLVLFIGTLLEGETVLILAGVAAQQGYLSYPYVVLTAFSGGFLGDQVFFFLGRYYGAILLERFPSWKAKTDRIHAMTERYHAAIILLIHFMYGLRTVGPAALGTGPIPTWKFSLYNLISVAVWAVLVGGLGMVFGGTAELILHKAEQYQLVLLAAALIAAGIVVYYRRRQNNRSKP